MKTRKIIKKNPKLWHKYFLREKIIQIIRQYFIEKNFHEVETPLLVPSLIPESYLDVFETFLKGRNGKKQQMFLTTSPEASIKKLLTAGIGNCFEITKSFRNGETQSYLHSPEFTILEWYRINADYKDIMKDCENLFIYLNSEIIKSTARAGSFKMSNNCIKYQNYIIDLTPPWEKITVEEALKKFSNISFNDIIDNEQIIEDKIFSAKIISQVAKRKGYHIEKENTWEEIFNQIFLNEIEPFLGTEGKPTIIYDYPKPLAALANIKSSNRLIAERFEIYAGRLELGDCYTELTDFKEQKKRFTKEVEIIKKKRKTPIVVDKKFIEALKTGLPPCAGIAVGIDRLVMLFTNSKTIQETLLFPIEKF